MATSPPSLLATGDNNSKQHWWLTNRKMVDKYVKEARFLIATREHTEIASALNLLDAALSLSPRFELALELKARSLLYLHRYKDVADLLHDYIPSLKMAADDDSSSSSSSSSSSHSTASDNSSKERVKLLSSRSSSGHLGEEIDRPSFKCFSVSDLKKKVMAGLFKNCDKQGQWRYLVLGQACCHLGLMEDAVLLLQTGKRLATAALRRESICWSEDSFAFSKLTDSGSELIITSSAPPPRTESESLSQLLAHIKLLLRRKTAAIAALDAGLYSEAIRHFSKIVDSRRGAPQGFLAECYMYRASAYKSANRIAESIADCNRTLALEPSCIEALRIRASLFESIRCLPDSLHDLEHLKLLYNSILRDRKLPGPAWKRQYVAYREIPGRLCSLATKMQELKQRLSSGETGNVDYYALIGLRRGCSLSELERANLLLTLKHKPDKSSSFVDRCEFANEDDFDSVRDRSKLSALLLYRLIQKGYTSVKKTIREEEEAEKQRKKAAVALQEETALQLAQQQQQQNHRHHHHEQQQAQQQQQKQNHHHEQQQQRMKKFEAEMSKFSEVASSSSSKGGGGGEKKAVLSSTSSAAVYQGVFCRDIAAVGSLLSQVGFNRPITVKYEALSC